LGENAVATTSSPGVAGTAGTGQSGVRPTPLTRPRFQADASLKAAIADGVRGGGESPGVFLLAQSVPIAEAIEQIVLIWNVTDAGDWKGRLVWLPL
jgi:hypothetical protein